MTPVHNRRHCPLSTPNIPEKTARRAKDLTVKEYEALENGIKIVVVITEHITIKDAIDLMVHAKTVCATVIGPNTPGIIAHEECKLGILPSHVFTPGNTGLVSRSGTLTYEIAYDLTKVGIGQSTCIGLGGERAIGGCLVVVRQKVYLTDNHLDVTPKRRLPNAYIRSS